MPALVPKRGTSHKSRRDVALVYGVELRDAREEVFVMLVCDGLPMGVAFRRAGFESKAHDAPSNLFNLPRVQERAAAILEARKTQGAVTLPEVTSMLQRVFAGAHAAEEYSAAHNAAFSLARLYGHVTDRATLEVIRRPSRDPDAPSEMALGAWVEALPALPGPGPDASGPQGATFLRVSDAPAEPLGLDPIIPNDINGLDREGPSPQGPGPENLNEIKWLNSGTTGPGGRPENGAPSGPVTGTPDERAHSEPLGLDEPPGPLAKRGPPAEETGTSTLTGAKNARPRRVPDRQIPSFEELFG
jgi:hypothetical protein